MARGVDSTETFNPKVFDISQSPYFSESNLAQHFPLMLINLSKQNNLTNMHIKNK